MPLRCCTYACTGGGRGATVIDQWCLAAKVVVPVPVLEFGPWYEQPGAGTENALPVSRLVPDTCTAPLARCGTYLIAFLPALP